MALNPQLIRGAEFPYPANKGSEYTYMTTGNVKLKLILPERTIKEEGIIYLTSARLVFVKNPKSKTNTNFHGIEMPLHLIEKPKFEQPLFGVNYMTGTVKPLVGDPNSLQTSCTWNIMFTTGSSERFLSAFSHVYEAAKKKKTYGSVEHTQEPLPFSDSAYIDPNDPLHIYINEPMNANVYQPQNFSQNHYIPVPTTNMDDSSYRNNAMDGNYRNANNATNTNNLVPYPMQTVNDQISVYKNNANPCGNNMMNYPSQNNMSFQNSACSPPNISYSSQGGTPQYMQQPAPNYGQGNYNPQTQPIYNHPCRTGYNNYGQQNYGQQYYPPVNNEMNNPLPNHGYNSAKMGYQTPVGTNEAQQQNQINPTWNSPQQQQQQQQQQPDAPRVTELTGAKSNNFNTVTPYRR